MQLDQNFGPRRHRRLKFTDRSIDNQSLNLSAGTGATHGHFFAPDPINQINLQMSSKPRKSAAKREEPKAEVASPSPVSGDDRDISGSAVAQSISESSTTAMNAHGGTTTTTTTKVTTLIMDKKTDKSGGHEERFGFQVRESRLEYARMEGDMQGMCVMCHVSCVNPWFDLI